MLLIRLWYQLIKVLSSERNQKQSPFLRLPRELRDMVYGFALDTAIICLYYEDNVCLPSSLIQVCRQIRQEAQPYYHCITVLTPRPKAFDVIHALEFDEPASFLREVRVIELSDAVARELVWAERLKTLSFEGVLDSMIGSFPALETIVWPYTVKGECTAGAGELAAAARDLCIKPDLRVIVKVPRNAAHQKLTMG